MKKVLVLVLIILSGVIIFGREVNTYPAFVFRGIIL